MWLSSACSLFLFGDDAGFHWHRRVLVLRTSQPVVPVAARPNRDLDRLGFNRHRGIALTQGGIFPQAQRGHIYHFARKLSPLRHGARLAGRAPRAD